MPKKMRTMKRNKQTEYALNDSGRYEAERVSDWQVWKGCEGKVERQLMSSVNYPWIRP